MIRPAASADTAKSGCRMVAEALAAFGVRHVVTSPGSRNAPLIMAVSRRDAFRVHSVVDERSAAFVGLGMAAATGEPVALICTSGTALLNYAPAVAEAYYRHVPLIVVSADRPEEWIDQNDSQTIRQPGALANIVKASAVVPGELLDDDAVWMANRQLNDMLHTALCAPCGPVHVNVPLSMPLTSEAPFDDVPLFSKIELIGPDSRVSTELARRMAAEASGRRVLVVASQCMPDDKVNKAMATLAALPDVAVLAEGVANISVPGVIPVCDSLFSGIDEEDESRFAPDLLICFGGAPVSDGLKRFLRRTHPQECWRVGIDSCTIDTYRSITRRIDIEPRDFFPRFSASMKFLVGKNSRKGSFAHEWAFLRQENIQYGLEQKLPWCGYAAVKEIISTMAPVASKWDLQLGNGMSVRYALAADAGAFHRIDSNRGVSGIDGSVSTAVGASVLSKLPTLLIVGDMSMQYDIGALASTLISPSLAIVVMSNGGGGIFDYVATTRSLPELSKYFRGEIRLPLGRIAEAYGFEYHRAADFSELADGMAAIARNGREKPLILEVITDSVADASVFTKITKRKL